MTPRPSLLGVSVLNYITLWKQFNLRSSATQRLTDPKLEIQAPFLGVPCLCPCMDVVADEDHPDQISGV